ncbi:MAG: ISAs1 family transposase [Planctomycetota bacterium]
MSSAFVETVTQYFEEVTDPRVNRGQNYPLIEMVFVALCGSICDCNSWVDVSEFGHAKLAWFRKFLPFKLGVPSHDTFSEVFARLDSVQFYAALQSWTTSIAGSLQGQTVAFDGKTLCGSFDQASAKSALHSVSAWVCGLKLCLGLKSVEDKSNEIPAVQQLIDLIDLRGAIVTADAMHCQIETAAKIADKGADYVLVAKGNQKSLQSEIREVLAQAFEENDSRLRQCSSAETSHGRDETRHVVVMPAPKSSKIFSRWPNIQTIGAIYRTRDVDGKQIEWQDCFISSLSSKVRNHRDLLRSHWSIENCQHHILDVTFTEDSSRIRKGTGPEISSVFRRLALTILQQDTSIKGSLRGKRKICGWDESAFERLLAGFSEV